MGTIFLYEIAGTAMLMLLGVGVVANVVLGKTKGNGGGWLLISFGWGLAVFAGVYVAYKTGAHLNPAVTFGILSSGRRIRRRHPRQLRQTWPTRRTHGA